MALSGALVGSSLVPSSSFSSGSLFRKHDGEMNVGLEGKEGTPERKSGEGQSGGMVFLAGQTIMLAQAPSPTLHCIVLQWWGSKNASTHTTLQLLQFIDIIFYFLQDLV